MAIKKKFFGQEDGAVAGESTTLMNARSKWQRSEIMLDIISMLHICVQCMGPLTAIYCHIELEFSLRQTGIIMAVQYVPSVIMNPIFGYIMDNSTAKRPLLAMAFFLTAITYAFLLVATHFLAVLIVILIQSLVAGIHSPSINALSLGLVGPHGFTRRCTRNEMLRHCGAVLAGVLAVGMVPHRGWSELFLTLLLLSLVAMGAVCGIDPRRINHVTSRGSAIDYQSEPIRLRALFFSGAIVMLLAAVVLFHMGNAGMLPMMGERIEELRGDNETQFDLPVLGQVDGTVGIELSEMLADALSIPIAFVAGRYADRPGWGRRRVAMIGFALLPLRGLVLSFTDNIALFLCMQLLEACGSAIVGVVAIIMVHDLTTGTGRFSTLQGSLAGAVGVGAGVSKIVAGYVSDSAGFTPAFLTLAGVACVGLVILMLMKETKPELLSPKAYLPYYDGATEHLLEDDRYEIMNTEFDISHLGISSK